VLTILVKTIVSTNNNTSAKSIADTSSNTAFEKYCQYYYYYYYYYMIYIAPISRIESEALASLGGEHD